MSVFIIEKECVINMFTYWRHVFCLQIQSESEVEFWNFWLVKELKICNEILVC